MTSSFFQMPKTAGAPGSLPATLYPLAKASLGFSGSAAEAGTVFRRCTVRR